MNQTAKKRKEERARRIIEKAYRDARKLKFGRIIIYIQDGYAFRIETTESDTGKEKSPEAKKKRGLGTGKNLTVVHSFRLT